MMANMINVNAKSAIGSIGCTYANISGYQYRRIFFLINSKYVNI